MFKEITSREIIFFVSQKEAKLISRWESIEKAQKYYSNSDQCFVGYTDERKNLKSAYSTPVKVYILKKGF